jgi:hypothetical protein
VEVAAGHVKDRLDVEISLAPPEITEGDVLGVPQQPGGLVVQRLVAFLQGADAEGYAQGAALGAELATGKIGGGDGQGAGWGRGDHRSIVIIGLLPGFRLPPHFRSGKRPVSL